MGGLSRSFNKEFWNYAKLISGVLRHGMPLHYVVDLIGKMNLYDENINQNPFSTSYFHELIHFAG
jgi:ribonucleoside-diphosphate reductase alpha chain